MKWKVLLGLELTLLCIVGVIAAAAQAPEAMETILLHNDKEYVVARKVLHLPANRWQPETQKFPANLREHIDRASRYLKKEKGIEDTIRVRRISVQRLVPDSPDEEAKTYGPVWILFFRFAVLDPAKKTSPNDHVIVMLLDGTIAMSKTKVTEP